MDSNGAPLTTSSPPATWTGSPPVTGSVVAQIDSVFLIPEPATVVLLLPGLAWLGRRSRS